jgi:hypothetical protein
MSSELFALHLFLWSFSTSISNVPTDFPANIVVQSELRRAVAQLWAGSPTFRAQCQKIGEHPRYRVSVVIEPGLSISRGCRAQCVMRVYSSGFVNARVMVPHHQRELAELIPHELEHVIEHIDGVNVRRDMLRQANGTYDAGSGRIETTRAVRVGRQAKDELVAGTAAVGLLTRR